MRSFLGVKYFFWPNSLFWARFGQFGLKIGLKIKNGQLKRSDKFKCKILKLFGKLENVEYC